jgi:hypothetical protein
VSRLRTKSATLAALALNASMVAGVADDSLRDQRRHDGQSRPRVRTIMGEAEARGIFVGKTRVTFMPGHGTQISYMRPDGAIFLWYPGNAVVLPGRWRIEARWAGGTPPAKEALLCFQYRPNTYNPVTQVLGGRQECVPARAMSRFIVDRADGDIFGLAGRSSAPFRLAREPTTIAAVKAQIGRAR